MKHPRNDFLIERLAFFSDAVFAIAITLMVIEIHPPLVNRGDTDEMVWDKFRETLPEFLGLLVSFWLIASSWLRHHQLFKYLDKYDMSFVLLNLWLLFTIILFPFSTSFLFNSLFAGGVSKLQVYFYLGVPLGSNFLTYCMYQLANKRQLIGEADVAFRNSVLSQGMMVLSFLLAIVWVILMPLQYHMIGYAFLGCGPIVGALLNKKRHST